MVTRSPVDDLDARLIALLADRPQIGVLGASRELGVARGTVQARLDRLVERGVISSLAPTIDPVAMGFTVTAFCTLAIQQHGGQQPVLDHLASIPQVIEVHTITGDGDLMVRIVARDNTDLQRVIDRVVSTGLVTRTSSVIALAELIGRRTLPLVQAAAEGG
ncbi:Lrp/AsnC family transcriptional regulator [Luteipulveratus halotolerans]|uniref:AsnC family transcriptional regulator n=1 Tax=Luteipulveratus halotolerans TaxID=1631356 RepID=A0A0L6CIN8_9MICO|nr:Lrp/AsnC family transcriptional regulator [Luteipulveratus halotolerans]KNX37666.1 AsnC family transcriptional regulator [Luteipulveratus halotolerans]